MLFVLFVLQGLNYVMNMYELNVLIMRYFSQNLMLMFLLMIEDQLYVSCNVNVMLNFIAIVSK